MTSFRTQTPSLSLHLDWYEEPLVIELSKEIFRDPSIRPLRRLNAMSFSFRDIRAWSGPQAGAFEELYCQLAEGVETQFLVAGVSLAGGTVLFLQWVAQSEALSLHDLLMVVIHRWSYSCGSSTSN